MHYIEVLDLCIRRLSFKDYVALKVITPEINPHAQPCPAQISFEIVQGNSTTYMLTNFVSIDIFSPRHQAFLDAIDAGIEPQIFTVVILHKVWHGAISNEIDSREINKTWDVESLPPGKVAIGSKWVFKLKYNVDGTVECH